MLVPDYGGRFKREYKLAIKRGLNMTVIDSVIKDLINEIPLDPKLKEHPLKGNYAGYLECHIEPDWLLVYKIDKDAQEIYFSRTGTHADLFQ
jgi:mRNA interferase YafQ